ncbi:baseplate J/gp47 family protein [Salmonella enterica subsp. enterica serovar Bispebjerg]|uniref:baseplate J/gp47 family protein n=1 Tax=Salmonella enterica TaxID=28901 RepID=UPI0022E83D82|nr:baseplate J/gp47 family protein [Salmonella enterica]WBQ81087.1 baseplate J/gp47 family protein [Salmonella enterica subsp. enterica serovar Bispebjerg]
MAYLTPDAEKIRADLLRDLKNQLPDADTAPDSDYFVRASSVASVAEGLYQHQAWVVRQIFPDTSDSDYLALHARTRGLKKKPPTTAKGLAGISGSPGSVLPAGSQIRGESLAVTTTADVKLTAGTADVPVTAIQSGVSGNLDTQVMAELVSAPMGINGRVVVKSLTGGTDEESDGELLDRLLDIIRRPPAGGNRYDYRRWAMEVPGVSSAWVYPIRRGAGTVDIAITSAGGLASDEIIRNVQAHIDDVRPVTARNALVLSPQLRRIDFDVIVKAEGVTLEQLRPDVERTIRDAMARIAPGQPLIRSNIETLISLLPGVTDRTIVTPAANVIAQVDGKRLEWLLPGVISVRDK